MYLGLDLGTSELKALLLADDHRIVGVARAPLTVDRPQPLWSEQAPAQWWQALEAVMAELRTTHAEALPQVRAIGLSGQMHGATLLDAVGEVLRPAILWNDGRSGAQCEALTRAVPRLGEIAGNLAMPGFTAPKLLWVREHEPEVFARVARVLLPKDWLRFMLSGEAVSEMSDAAGTLWLDVGARDWSDELLAATGLTRDHMPRLVEGSEVSALLKPELAACWGLREGVKIAGGAGDNAASAVGMGLVEPGQGFVSLGTSGVVFVSTDRFLPNPAQAMHAFCHALPRRWHQMSVMLSAASAVSWAAKTFKFADEAALLEAAASVALADRARCPLFLPYLSGERSPHNNPNAQGVLFGLTHAHGPAEIAYAVVEGVSFGLRDGFDTLRLPADMPLREVALVGGGARSAWWGQLLADIFQVPLTLYAGSETGGALGAARLAWLADGGAVAEVCTLPPVKQTLEPSTEGADGHRTRHARFQVLYMALRDQFR
ncbi:xylulokinase [Variovorax boronicumulans]|uniref:xylulokinase n=1 Tax=Variovorax boronicumulans TaxID=436515 RepID=UPI003398A5BA